MTLHKNKPYIKIYRPFMNVTLLLQVVGSKIKIFDEELERWGHWASVDHFYTHWLEGHEDKIKNTREEYTWPINQFSFFEKEEDLFLDHLAHKEELTRNNDKNLRGVYCDLVNNVNKKDVS